MAFPTTHLAVWFAALLTLSCAPGCGTTRPPWKASRATASKPADDAELDLEKLPTGVRVALENGMFRDDDVHATATRTGNK
jgi:hypothetical protein